MNELELWVRAWNDNLPVKPVQPELDLSNRDIAVATLGDMSRWCDYMRCWYDDTGGTEPVRLTADYIRDLPKVKFELGHLIFTGEKHTLSDEGGEWEFEPLTYSLNTRRSLTATGGSSQASSEHIHPHIDLGGSVCLGQGRLMFRSMLLSGLIQEAFETLDQWMGNFNPHDAYAPLTNWYIPVPTCHDCGEYIRNVRYVCGDCNADLCNSCVFHDEHTNPLCYAHFMNPQKEEPVEQDNHRDDNEEVLRYELINGQLHLASSRAEV